MSAFEAARNEPLHQVALQLTLQPDRRQCRDRRTGPRRGGRRITDLVLDPLDASGPGAETHDLPAGPVPGRHHPSTEQTVLSIVDEHSCEVMGTLYAATPKWVAVQHGRQAGTPRYLLCVEFTEIAELGDGPAEVRLLVSFTDASELPGLLNEALEHRLVADRIDGLSQSPSKASVQQWLEALWPDARYPGRRGGGLPN
jgi:hypothetical protein